MFLWEQSANIVFTYLNQEMLKCSAHTSLHYHHTFTCRVSVQRHWNIDDSLLRNVLIMHVSTPLYRSIKCFILKCLWGNWLCSNQLLDICLFWRDFKECPLPMYVMVKLLCNVERNDKQLAFSNFDMDIHNIWYSESWSLKPHVNIDLCRQALNFTCSAETTFKCPVNNSFFLWILKGSLH